MLNRLLAAALVAGFVAGIGTAIIQQFTTTPLILEAERYEVEGHHHPAPATAGQDAGAGAAQAWGPEDGLQRIFFTSVSTVGTAFGFAMVLLGVMLVAKRPITARTGVLWGAAAFVATGLAPAIGLSPELPGSAAADLTARQFWWAGAVLATSAGLWLTLAVSSPLAICGGIALLVAPHLIGAPHPAEFTSQVPGELSGLFVSASLAAHAVMWVLTGAVAGYMWHRGEAATAGVSAPA